MMRELKELLAFGTFDFWVNVGLVLLCVTMAALAAGLTMGLLALEPFRLRILLATEEEDCHSPKEVAELKEEKRYASMVLPVISRHHFLLVSLLLLNSIANEALPIFLDELVPTSLAIVLSVTFVLLFGEIIPSAIFTGPRQLQIAAAFIPFVWVVQFVFFPIAWPISKILDYLLGHDMDGKFNKAELRALVKLHGKRHGEKNHVHDYVLFNRENIDRAKQRNRKKTVERTLSQYTEYTNNELDVDEVTIIQGAMDLKEVQAKDVMTSLEKVFMMEISETLSRDVLSNILDVGHSRLPIFEGSRQNIRGLLLVKKLIVLNPSDSVTVRSIGLRQPLYIPPEMTLLELLNHFQVGKSHMAFVCTDPKRVESAIRSGKSLPKDIKVMGMLTLEDLIEILIQENITDETDKDELALMELARAKKLKQLSEFAKFDAEMQYKSKLGSVHSGANSVVSVLGSASSSRYHNQSSTGYGATLAKTNSMDTAATGSDQSTPLLVADEQA